MRSRFSLTERLDYYTAALYTVMTFPIRERISLRARAGVLYENWKYRDKILGDTSDTAVELSIGGGAISNLNEYLNLIAEGTIIESNIIYTSAGVQQVLIFRIPLAPTISTGGQHLLLEKALFSTPSIKTASANR